MDSKRNVLLARALAEFEHKIMLRLKGDITDNDIDQSSKNLDSEEELHITPQLSDVLQTYGNLVFFIQNDPKYLATLADVVDHTVVDQLIQLIIFTLFPNPFDHREESLLLSLIQTILQNRYKTCVDRTTYLRENSGPTKLLSAYTKREPCRALLRHLLKKPLQQLINQSSLDLEINPRKIFDKMKMSGQKQLADGPDSPEIQKMRQERLNALFRICDSFLQPIFDAVDKFPFGMRVTCKFLQDLALGDEDEDLAFKLVGGFIFLRFINPSIIDPRSVDSDLGPSFPSNVRRNLVQVAIVLQKLSNGAHFGGKNEDYMAPVNTYMDEKKSEIQAFFTKVAAVENLEDHLKVDNYLEKFSPTEPLVYMSLKEMLFLQTELETHRKIIVPKKEDQLVPVLDSLLELKAKENFGEEASKFVTLRVVDWMSGKRRGRASTIKTDEVSRLQSFMLPVLRSLVRTRSSQLSLSVSAYQPPDQQLSALLLHAAEVATETDNRPLLRQIEDVQNQLKKVKSSSRTEVVSSALQRIHEVVSQRHLLQNQLSQEVGRLQNALQSIHDRYDDLQSAVTTFKAYLQNIRNQTFYKLGWDRGSIAGDQDMLSSNLLDVDSVLSTSGLIGGLLAKVQQDVAQSLTTFLHEGKSIERVFEACETKTGHTASRLSDLFPRNASYYRASLSTFATVGKCCMNDLVEMVLNTLPSKLEIMTDKKTSTDSSKFSWGAFFQIVPTLDMAKPTHLDILDLLVELMAVDILAAVLQHYNDGKGGSSTLVLGKSVVDDLISLAYFSFNAVTKPPRKNGMDKATYATMRTEISNKWAVILGLLCPYNAELVVDVLDQACSESFKTKEPSKLNLYLPNGYQLQKIDADLIFRGLRYLHFMTETNDVVDYLTVILEALQCIKGTNSKDIAVQNSILRSLEMCLRLLDLSTAEKGKVDTDRTSRIFFEFVGPIYQEVLGRVKNEDLKTRVLRVCNTVITHAPESFFASTAEGYLTDVLCNKLDNSKKRSQKKSSRLHCVLHFLKGGCVSADWYDVTHVNGKPIDKASVVYGSAKRKVPEKLIGIIFSHIFEKKGMARLPDVARICERIVVQMALHNFKYVTDSVLKMLFDSKEFQEQLVGLRALEILVDSRSGFHDFAIRCTDGQAAKTRLSNTINALSSTMLPKILQIVKNLDKLVGVKSMGQTASIVAPSGVVGEERAVATHVSRRFVSPQDIELERWIDLDMYDTNDELHVSLESGSGLFAEYGPKEVPLELYYHALRLFPQIMPESMLESKSNIDEAGNAGSLLEGLFVGRLVVHPVSQLSRAAYAGLRRTMAQYPNERSQVMDSFLQVLANSAFQEPSSLTSLFLHTIGLVRQWGRMMVEEHHKSNKEKKVTGLNDPILATLPAYLQWMYRADATGLVYMSHSSLAVRNAALELILEVQKIHRIRFRTLALRNAPEPSTLLPKSIMCVGDIIAVFNEEIMRSGMRQYLSLTTSRVTEEKDSRQSNYRNLNDFSKTAKHLPSFNIMLGNYQSLIPHCVSMLSRIVVELMNDTTTLTARRLLRMRVMDLSKLKLPMAESEDHKHPISSSLRGLWVNYHALFFAMCGTSYGGGYTRIGASFSGSLVQSKRSSDSRTHMSRLHSVHSTLEKVIAEFWNKVLGTEVDWVKQSSVVAACEIHADSVAFFVNNLYNTYLELEKKRRKKALVLVTVLLNRLPFSIEFTHGLRLNPRAVLSIYKTFIHETRLQLWDPKKLTKAKWSETQVDLALVVASVTSALNQVGSEIPDDDEEQLHSEIWDEKGSISMWDLKDRYDLFTWLLQFTNDTVLHTADIQNNNQSSQEEKDAAIQRQRVVKNACSLALENLCGLGPVIPDAEVANFLLGRDQLSRIIEIQNGSHRMLGLLLCFHHRVLLSVYIDRVYQHKQLQTSELYFRAISEVFSIETGFDRLASNVRKDSSVTKIIGGARLSKIRDERFLASGKAYLGKLIHLALLQMASDSVFTRFSAFEMIRSVIAHYIGNEEASAIDQYRFAFESQLPSWAQNSAILVSEHISRTCSDISVPIFREAFQCLKNTNRYRPWIVKFLLPWSENIQFTPLMDSDSDHSEIVANQEKLAAEKPNVVVANVHTTTTILLQLFMVSVDETVPLSLTLPLWERMAGNTENVAAMMQFLVSKVSEKEVHEANVLHAKNILFSLYTNSSNRQFIILAIMRYFLRVLKQNAGQWSKSNLKNRLRSSRILSVLESKDCDFGDQLVSERGLLSHGTHEFKEYDFDDETLADEEKKANEVEPESESSSLSSSVASSMDSLPSAEVDAEMARRGSLVRVASLASRPSVIRSGSSQSLEHNRQHVIASKMVEKLQSHVVAAMLVELIGRDEKPILPYYPIIVLYAVIHLNDRDEFVRRTMHQLLTRLLCVIGGAKTVDPAEMLGASLAPRRGSRKSIVTRMGGPLLSEALQTHSLQLVWKTSGHTKLVSGPKGVVMYADSFISQYCQCMERKRAGSVSRIGYESLRWAILSTDLAISNMAFTIYRSLLSPMNEASTHALLLTLLGSLEDWERQMWYLKSDLKAGAANLHGGASHGAGVEAGMVVDTLIRISERLLSQGEIYKHPILLWTAVALLRCDQTSIYDRALHMLHLVLPGYPYLFESTFHSRLSISMSPDHDVNDEDIDDEVEDENMDDLEVNPLSARFSENVKDVEADRAVIPENFWSYSEKWNPRFEGTQPYLLQGLLSPVSEGETLASLSLLNNVAWDNLVDVNSTRQVITVVAFIPRLFLRMRGEASGSGSDDVLDSIIDILKDIGAVVSQSAPQLQECFEKYAGLWRDNVADESKIQSGNNNSGSSNSEWDGDADLADSFLRDCSSLIATFFFPDFATPVASFLTEVLKSEFREYQIVVLKMVNEFLKQNHALTYVDNFAEVIHVAHSTVTFQKGMDSDESMGNLAFSASVSSLRTSAAESFPENDISSLLGREAHVQMTKPAADLVATVITLFNSRSGKKQGDELKKSPSVMGLRALPIRSLRNAIDALTQIVRLSPSELSV